MLDFCYVHTYSKDFGAEVRQLFQIITSDELSAQEIKEILAQSLGISTATVKAEENYNSFLMEQAR